MNELIIISGPQAAGKSTIISKACAYFQALSPVFETKKRKMPLIFPLQESRQIIAHKDMLLGAIFMTKEQEEWVAGCDLERMDMMRRISSRRVIYLDECNIFTIAHAKAHGIKDIYRHWKDYSWRLEDLNAKVIFLDIDPELSWERRWRKYEQRLIYFHANRHKSIMRRYREYLEKLRPALLEVYEKLPLPKVLINARVPEKEVLQQVIVALTKLSDSFNSH
jgi:thymidylate kinase